MTDDIKVIFIVPNECRDENDCSEEMQLAFIACEQHRGGGLQAQWVPETQWTEFEGLTKKNVFVLSEFSGVLYEKLRLTKCLLVGPRCLSCCLTEGTSIPSGPEPIYTVAMRGVVVTASGLSKQQKEKIKKKVHWMGGIYNTVLTDATTHLVSDTVLSDKYLKSVQKDIPIMAESWVEAVWETSLRLNINGQSSDFDNHKLPPFANLQLTTSGISKKEKQLIMKLVNENGGQFSGAFQSETTDVVVLNKDGVGSEKYKAALEYGKACVVPEWVKESAAKKVALPLMKYRVAGASTSSPLSNHSRIPDMSLNFSRITNLRPPSNYVDESRANDVSTMSGKMKMSQESKKSIDTSEIDKEVQAEIENFDMSQLKNIGPIFDGYCIWVVGAGSVTERVSVLVSRLCGVRYSAPHARVTHALAGGSMAARRVATALPAVPVLRLHWLLDSIRKGEVQNENDYLYDVKPKTPSKSSHRPGVEPASPMSKRNLQLLRHATPSLPPPAPLPAPENVEDDLVNHYLSQHITQDAEPEKSPEPSGPQLPNNPDITEDITDDPTEEIEQIFRGMKIEVQGLDEEAICELAAEVGAAGGVLVAPGAEGHGPGGQGSQHVIVPLDFSKDELITKDAEAVTVFWLKDCLSQQELLPIQYYHRPVSLKFENVLKGVVASLSTYSGVERAFLDELAKLQGATHTWLLECAEKGIRVSEKSHLVGETSVPSPTKQHDELTDDDGPPDGQTKVLDKENAMLPPPGTEVPRRGSTAAHSGDDTPKTKLNVEGEGMSPASRYIAMARQGLLMDSQDTPKRVHELISHSKQGPAQNVRTPPLDDALSTPNLMALSPTTRRRIQAVKRGEMPSDPIKTPVDPFVRKTVTPDSGWGAALRPDTGRMSPDARKRLWDVVQDLPTNSHLPLPQDKTPLSEIRNRFLAQFNRETTTPPTDHHPTAPRKLLLQDQDQTPPTKMAKTSNNQSAGTSVSESRERSAGSAGCSSSSSSSSRLPAAVDAQLQRLSAALSGKGTPQRVKRTRDSVSVPVAESEPAGPESQPNTVGWDDSTPAQSPPQTPPTQVKCFMLSSNVDNREEIVSMIVALGGVVTEGGAGEAEASHLVCAAPGRSEKMLGSIAAGRWVLHPAYVARSHASQAFLNEEEFEWGNPLATSLPVLAAAEQALGVAAHRWRVARGVSAGAGPFARCVALLHVPPARRRLLARLISAGGGLAPDDQPPYANEDVTVCFADIKRYPISERDKAWLRSRRIPVCAPILLSSFLTEDPQPDPEEHCLPDFRYK